MIIRLARAVIGAAASGEKTEPEEGEMWCGVCDRYVDTEVKYQSHDGSIIDGCVECGNTILDPVAPHHATYGRAARG